MNGLLVMKNMDLTLMDRDTATKQLNLNMADHQLRFTSSVKIHSSESVEEFFANLKLDLEEYFRDRTVEKLAENSLTVDSVLLKLRPNSDAEGKKSSSTLKHLLISWRFEDEGLGSRVLEYLTPSNNASSSTERTL